MDRGCCKLRVRNSDGCGAALQLNKLWFFTGYGLEIYLGGVGRPWIQLMSFNLTEFNLQDSQPRHSIEENSRMVIIAPRLHPLNKRSMTLVSYSDIGWHVLAVSGRSQFGLTNIMLRGVHFSHTARNHRINNGNVPHELLRRMNVPASSYSMQGWVEM
ncbi:hypothetical protein P692DRAFT_20825790 [Suillus brevipes Sb2]|nr:hypothetical protein P692DRAFT_20825790 [Suillus brevipes Sb2]